MGVQTVYIRYIHTIQCYLLIRSNKFVLGRDIPSVGDFILKYSENFDSYQGKEGCPKTCSKSRRGWMRSRNGPLNCSLFKVSSKNIKFFNAQCFPGVFYTI